MTPEVMEFVKSLKLSGGTLEIGSYDVNGSIRHLFNGSYMGLDRRQGPNVDRVCDGHQISFQDGVFDNVICLETLEHDECFWMTISEMKRVLKSGGRLVITVPGFGFPRHDYPSDYYRFSKDAVQAFYSGLRDVTVTEQNNAIYSHGVKP